MAFPGEFMSTEWHYNKGDKQYGPISSSDLKGLAEAGEIGPDDLVWNSSLTEWVPAQRVKGLEFATAPTTDATAPAYTEPDPPPESAPLPASPVLAYQAPASSQAVAITLRSIDLLSRTRNWVLIMAIGMFLWVAFLLIAGAGMLFFLTVPSGRSSGPAIAAGLAYLGLGVVMAMPPLYLTKYYAQIGNLRRLRRPADLENALDAQRAYWKYLAITTLVIVGIYVGVIVAAFLGVALM
jgi:hypothetical protein